MGSEESIERKEIKQNKLVFILNEEDKTANVISNDDVTGDIYIPPSIKHETNEYSIEKILRFSFKNSKTIKSIQFPSNSKIQTIEKESFAYSTLEKINIPSSLSNLEEGWCKSTSKLTKITIMPNNESYQYIDNKMVIGKDDKKSDNYDVLIFVRRDIEEITIPTFIKRIASYALSETRIQKVSIPPHITKICEGAFYHCEQLYQVEIPPDSELETIEREAFSETSIETISIPATVTCLKEGWCINNSKLKQINIIQKDQENSEKTVSKSSHISDDKLLDNIQCPVCYLAMLPPARSPMIIPACGHTVCEYCILKLEECPLCHKKIAKPTKNMLAAQLIDSIKQDINIPPEINPPPPSVNKLIPKIVPICTLVTVGKNCNQKFYHCVTCKILGDNFICEICASKCHNGHEIMLIKESNRGSCVCSSFCECKCISNLDDLRCTYELTYGTHVKQPMYQCEDCHVDKYLYMCQNCAIKCHQGHKVRFVGFFDNKICHCFDQCFCKIASPSRKPICTYIKTGPNYVKQPFYYCHTCGLANKCGCCSACANYCHKDHAVEFHQFADDFYCDCGDCSHFNCQILPKDENSSYLTNCPNLHFLNKDKKINQRKYYCMTCGINGTLGICEACAINCHINHSIKYVGIEEFSCTCQSTKNCMMMMVPKLHDDRECCDRQVLDKNDISACYTCYTCDISGRICICETCALKKHIKHDVHFIGYMEFDCYG